LRRSLATSVLLIAVCVHAEWAMADDDGTDERVAQLYQDGRTHYDLGEYEQAIAAFKEAYRLAEAPGFLFNIAQAHRLAGDCAAAERFYRSYLRYQPDAENRGDIEARIEEMERCHRERGAEIEGTKAPVLTVPRPRDSAAEKPVGRAAQVDAETTPMRTVAFASLVAGGLTLAGGGVFYYRSSRDATALEKRRTAGGEWTQDDADLEDSYGRQRGIAIGGLAVGAALVATGGGLLWNSDRAPRARRVSLALTGAGPGLEAAWTF